MLKKVLMMWAAWALITLPNFLPLQADEKNRQAFNIDAQSLAAALSEFARQSKQELLFSPEIVAQKKSEGVKGTLDPLEALNTLLKNTGIVFSTTPNGAILLRDGGATAANESSEEVRLARSSEMQKIDGETQQLKASRENQVALRQSDPKIDEVIVTGTHIGGTNPVGSNLIVIARDELLSSGYDRVQDFLEMLPQNFSGSAGEDWTSDPRAVNSTRGQSVDLRGLGAGSTLVLINGRRQPSGGLQGSFVDISSIAMSAVERIEVLTDGASAVYGSDAVGGVVNFILRKDFEGLEATTRLAAMGGDAKDLQTSLFGGKNWKRANLTGGYQYSHRDALMIEDSLRRAGGPDYRSLGGSDFRTVGGTPGTITRTGGVSYAIPGGQDGTNLRVSDLVPGMNYRDEVTDLASLPRQVQHSAFFSLSFEMLDGLEAFAEGRYSKRDMALPFSRPTTIASVPSTNPFYINPYGGTAAVQVRYGFADMTGPTTQVSETETYSASAGAVGRIGGEWKLTGSANYAREDNNWEWFNNVNATRLSACLSGLPSSICPGRPLNVFGNGSNNDPLSINYIRETQLGEGDYTIRSVSMIADGPIFGPAGRRAKLAFGADFRDERLTSSGALHAPATGVTSPLASSLGNIKRDVGALFGELVVPIFNESSGHRFARRLEISLAGRYEDYSDFGSTYNPKVGINFSPMDDIRLRGSWGTSFRAPRFNEISLAANPPLFSAASVADPRSSTGFSNILLLIGGNEDLHEERAEMWTAGFDLTPTSIAGFELSVTYFNLNYEDKIDNPGVIRSTALQQENIFAELITRNPSQAQVDAICRSPSFDPTFGDPCPATAAAIVDSRLRNITGVRLDGIDSSVSYSVPAWNGRFRFGVAGTYMFDYQRALTSTSPSISVLNTVGNPLALRLRGTAGWERGGWSASMAINYANSYEDVALNRDVDSWTTVDLGVRYSLSGANRSGLRISVNVVNAFDEAPPFVNKFNGFDAANSSETGRALSLTISNDWGD